MQQQQQQIEEPEYPKVKQYIIKKTRLICGGLIGISVFIIQAFISIGVFDSSKKLECLAFFSVLFLAGSLPLLTARFLFTFEEEPRKFKVEHKWDIQLVYWAGILLASAGIVLTFWYIHWIAGLVILISMGIGAWIYARYSNKVYDYDEKLGKENIVNVKEEEDS